MVFKPHPSGLHCMCMIQMTLGVMQAIPLLRQWKRTWLCSLSSDC
jgi:hypothetical protein